MGSSNGCLKKPVAFKRNSQSTNSRTDEEHQMGEYGITVTPEKGLSFCHAPLYKNENLFYKFKEGSARPSQMTIPCMVSDLRINIQKGVIKVRVINQNPVGLWVVCGGIQKVSITGLTVKIDNISWCGCVKIDAASGIEGQWHAAKPKSDWSKCQNITVILTQVSQETSLFVYNVFSLKGQKKSQKIEWNSFIFNLQNIQKSGHKNLNKILTDDYKPMAHAITQTQKAYETIFKNE